MDSRFNDFKKGNEKAFRHYFDLYSRPLCVFVSAYLNDPIAAQDIAQECFVQLLKYREKIHDEEHLKYYLFKIARFRSIDAKKAEKKRKSEEYSWAEAQLHWDSQRDEVELMKVLVLTRLHELSKKMPARRREIFGLYFSKQMDVRSIAGLLDLKPSTVYNHLQHAFSYLVKEIPDPELLILVVILFLRRRQ